MKTAECHPLFTPEELAELEAYDAEIDADDRIDYDPVTYTVEHAAREQEQELTLSQKRARKYYQAHRKQISEQRREYYREHRREIIERSSAYYQAHAEERRAYHRAWCARNREHVRERNRAYYQAHREEIRARRREYRARKMKTTGGDSDE